MRGGPPSLGVFALAKGAVGDLAQQSRVVVQGADIAPVDLVGMRFKMIVAQGLQPLQHRVDLELGGYEGFEGFVVRGGGAAGGHSGVSGGELLRFRVITIALTPTLV